jgi:hypothetical protein
MTSPKDYRDACASRPQGPPGIRRPHHSSRATTITRQLIRTRPHQTLAGITLDSKSAGQSQFLGFSAVATSTPTSRARG